jgi:hypothetical protein
MKFSFLVFLISITGLSLYAPNLKKKATIDINQTIETFKKDIAPIPQKLDKTQIEDLKNLHNELGLNTEKPLVEVEYTSPVMNKILKLMPKETDSPKTLREFADDFYLKTVDNIKFLISNYDSKITSFAVLVAFIAVISKWLDIYKLAYLLTKLGWFFSRFVLFMLSITAIALWFTLKKNLWLDVGNNLFFIPLQILIASSFSFKIMDSNFPIWNRLFGSFILPIISGITTTAITFL